MYTICPQCQSKNIKCIETEVEKIKCKCLECNYEFSRQPTVEERDAFNK